MRRTWRTKVVMPALLTVAAVGLTACPPATGGGGTTSVPATTSSPTTTTTPITTTAPTTTMPPVSCPTSLSLGITNHGCTLAAGAAMSFSVPLGANDHIYVRALRSAGTGGLAVTLFDAAGTARCTSSSILEYVTRSCVLPGPGTGRVEIKSVNGPLTYSLYSQRTRNPVGCAAMTLGSLSSGSISVAGEVDCFVIPAANDDVLRVIDPLTSSSLSLSLRTPAATEVCVTADFYKVGRACSDSWGGAALLLAFDGEGDSGSYVLWPQRMNDPVGCSALAYGETASATISTVGDVDCYRVPVSAADYIRTTATSAVNNNQMKLEIALPTGQLACRWTATTSCAVSVAGTATIIAYPDGSFTPTYDLWAQRTNNPGNCSTAAFGSTINGSIANPGNVRCYRLPIAVGDRLWSLLDRTAGLGRVEVEMFAPNGTAMPCRITATEYGDVECTSTAAGTLTVLVHAERSRTATYTLAIQRMNAPVGCSTLSYGVVVMGAISTPGEIDCYRVPVNAGDYLRSGVGRISGTGEMRVANFDPLGPRKCLGYAHSAPEAGCATAASGQATILVYGDESDTAGYSLTALRTNNPIGCSNVAYGQLLNATIGAVGEVDCYRIPAAYFDVIYGILTRTTGSGNVSIETHQPLGGVDINCGDGPGISAEQSCRAGSAGTITILVHAEGTSTPGYALYVQRANNPVGCPALPLGVKTAAALSVIGEVDCFRLAPIESTALAFRATAAGAGRVEVDVLNSIGYGGCGTNGLAGAEADRQWTCEAAPLGTYQTVLVHAAPGTTTTYDITVTPF